MKKEWKQPTLEVLNISMTMSGIGGDTVDGILYEPKGDESFPTHGPLS